MIKTLAKPLSKRIQHSTQNHPLGQRLLRSVGQSVHTVTSYMTVWAAGYRVRSITRLDDEKALKQGAEFVGETFIFCVSGGWVLYEYNQSQIKAAVAAENKRLQAKAERDQLRTQLHAIDVRLQALETALQNQWGISYRAPPEKTKVPIAVPLSPEDDDDDNSDENKANSKAPPLTVGEIGGSTTKTTPGTSANAAITVPPLQSTSETVSPSNNDSKSWTRWIWPF